MPDDNQQSAPRSLLRWSFAVAVAGFLFGFDTAVISGADQAIQSLLQTSDLFHGAFIMSSALWGTVIGAVFGSTPCDAFGRKPTLIAIGVLYLVSAVGTALAADPYTFSALRFVGGLGVGVSSIAVPAYISEIAPAERRGRLVALYQFQIVFGILIAFLSNYLLSATFGLDWRWMLGIEAVPAALYLAAIARVPESPRWLLLKGGNETEAFAIVRAVNPKRADEVIAEIRSSLADASDRLFVRRYRMPILLAILIAFFNQLSGINFVIYFAPRIFGLAGLDSSAALLSTTGVGIVNLLFTLLGVYLIDRAGRRRLMTLGSIGYLVSLSAVAWSFYTGASGMIVVLFVFLFIASHAVGQGAVIWVFIAEIFPNTVRSKGQSLGSGTHWVLAATIALLMPYALSAFEAHTIFGFFAVMMLLQLAFVVIIMPETRGRTLESVAEELTNQ
ncbi:MAG: sugar porter family MFS transporter [Pseudomonadota bacterium]